MPAKKSSPTLSKGEWQVMKVLWEKGELAARDVYGELKDESGWAYTTVKTILSRLVAKGAVAFRQIGNSYLYWASLGREELTHEEITSFLDRVLDGSLSPFLAHFIRKSPLSTEELRKLQMILKEKEEQTRPAAVRRED